jgi:tripartite ATP-independent transporter DctM subunit
VDRRPQQALAADAEDAIATLAIVGIAILPIAEVVLRRIFSTGIPGSASLIAHLTLVLGLIGAAIAAREGRLLALATGAMIPKGGLQNSARIFSALLAVLVTTVLALGGVRLLQVHYESGREITPGVPIWVADLAFPIAFGAIALRLISRSSERWQGRAIAALGFAAGVWISTHPELLLDGSAWPWMAALVAGAVVGMPIYALIGGAAVILFLLQGDSPANAVIGSYDQLTSSDLPAIPLFTFAGFLLAEGHASDRLLRLFRAWFGWAPGGTAIVVAVLCAFFTLLTGGSGVTILALGGLLLPALLADGYGERFSIGLLTAAGSLGLLFPPSLPLILYAVVAEVPIADLFFGGFLPGVLMLGALAALGVREGVRAGVARRPFSVRDALSASWSAKWELLLPVVIVGSLAAGATTVQSAALAALFTLGVQRFVQRDLASLGELRRVTSHTISLVGGILIVLAVAVGLTTYLIDAQVPARLAEWTTTNVRSRWMFLLGLNAFLIIVGGLMDIFSSIIVVVPLIVPIAAHFEVHPIHLGIIFIANAELGYLTPPVGENLFVSSYRFGKPILEVARAALPMYVILLIGVLVITYLPQLTMWFVE